MKILNILSSRFLFISQGHKCLHRISTIITDPKPSLLCRLAPISATLFLLRLYHIEFVMLISFVVMFHEFNREMTSVITLKSFLRIPTMQGRWML